jgi:hypothetical protein
MRRRLGRSGPLHTHTQGQCASGTWFTVTGDRLVGQGHDHAGAMHGCVQCTLERVYLTSNNA